MLTSSSVEGRGVGALHRAGFGHQRGVVDGPLVGQSLPLQGVAGEVRGGAAATVAAGAAPRLGREGILVLLLVIAVWAAASLPNLSTRYFIYEEGRNAAMAVLEGTA